MFTLARKEDNIFYQKVPERLVMNKPLVLLELAELKPPYPGHTETVVIGFYSSENNTSLHESVRRIIRRMIFIGGGMPCPTETAQKAKVVREELEKQGIVPVVVERVTVSVQDEIDPSQRA